MESPPPPVPPPPRPGWWARNWKWFVPIGCLGLSVALVAFIGLIVIAVFGAMKSSDVYRQAVAKAAADPAVIEALGSPIKPAMFLSGKVNVDGASGEADMAIPISGPDGKGTIYVVATKSSGVWRFSTFVVDVAKTKERINLASDTETESL